MILNRILGGCLGAASFVLLGLVMSSRGKGTAAVQIMDRLGLPFVLVFLVVQLGVLLLYARPNEILVSALLFAGGSALYAFINSGGSGIPLHYALFAGSSFSGLAAGAFVMMGDKGGSGKK
ncbi:MAG: hypothetical protein JSV00_10515 [bacterium]|nr:MAG: hypothetical protein JSV00_10515 [bacterium]